MMHSKRLKLVSFWILSVLLFISCKRNESQTYILEDLSEDEETRTYINLDRIYDYCYNINTFGSEELAKRKSAWWSPVVDRRIIINGYDIGKENTYINKLDYEFGFSDITEGRTWESYDTPLGVSPNGEYMFYQRKLSEVRYLMLYDYMNKTDIMIAKFDNKIIPPSLFEPVFSWGNNGNELVYGWKYIGEMQHVVALDEDYYYNNWRYGKDIVYSIHLYNAAKKVSTKLYEFTYWKFRQELYNYSIQINNNGYALLNSRDDKWMYLFNILDSSEHKTINKPKSLYETCWLGNTGIYIQENNQGIKYYDFESESWSNIVSNISDEIGHLITSKDGNTLYFSVRQESKAYSEYSNTSVWDIFRYQVDKKELECMYQGADDVIGLELNDNEANLMLEMRDYSYQTRYNDSLLTRIFVFKA